MISKVEQRKTARSKLISLSILEKELASQQIQERMMSFPGFLEAKTYFLFASLPSEPEIRGVFEKLSSLGKTIAFPVWHRAENKLTWHGVESWSELRPRSNSVVEPEFKKEFVFSPEEADWILVPGLAFDRRGYRLGRGAGMYDRTLEKLRPDTKKLGVFFGLQEMEGMLIETHDQRLDLVVTEKEIITIS